MKYEYDSCCFSTIIDSFYNILSTLKILFFIISWYFELKLQVMTKIVGKCCTFFLEIYSIINQCIKRCDW